MYCQHRIGVVIPAFNEAPAIGLVVEQILAVHHHAERVVDAIVVADNASTDGTGAVARAAGALVINEPRKGYGAACQRALATLPPCDVVVFMDGDRSMVAQELIDLLRAWQDGADLVIGSRRLGRSEPGALTLPQRWGNRLASFLLNWLWAGERARSRSDPITDLGPFRAIAPGALAALEMCDQTFGWTVEMQAKALRRGLRIVEVPVTSTRRIGRSKVSGTLAGTVGATIGILAMIARCWWQDRRSRRTDRDRRDAR